MDNPHVFDKRAEMQVNDIKSGRSNHQLRCIHCHKLIGKAEMNTECTAAPKP